MKQILAIFTKDARRFWPEIAVSLALTAKLALIYPMQWRQNNQGFGAVSYSPRGFFTHGGTLSMLAGALIILVPVSWWILIARLVHGERLVGHTQFWLTRPYRWRSFLAAKLLFLAVFIWLPFLAAQMLLLAQAGFNPFSYIAGLLWNLVLVTCCITLPLMVFSVVTTGFGRMTLLLLGLIVFIAAVATLISLLPSDSIAGIPSVVSSFIFLPVFVIGCTAVVVVQYARRRLRTAWLTLAGIAAALILLSIFDPDQSMLGRTYASASGAPPVQFAFAADTLRQPMTNQANDKREMDISIPISASQVPADSAIIPAALKAILDGPNGEHWESPWQGTPGEHFLPGSSDFIARFRIRRSVYERFKAAPLTVRLVFAFDRATLVSYTTIPLPRNEFTVPNVGVCAPQFLRYNNSAEITGINCRAPMREPDLTYITTHWSVGECTAGSEGSASLAGTAWVGSLDNGLAQLGITSVWDVPLYFSNAWSGYPARPRHICPGSTVTFARFALASRSQTTLTIPNFRLPELALGDQYRLHVDEYRVTR